MTEQVKVIHVVGQTTRQMQKNNMMIHHSIGFNPDHSIFNKASKDFRVAAAELQSEKGATDEIDRVLRECFVQSKPVYIFFPIDMVDLPVSAYALDKPLDLTPSFDSAKVDAAVQATLSALYASKNPALYVDCLVQRHQAVPEIRALADKLAIPTYHSNMGKGIIDHNKPYHTGWYNGVVSPPGVQAAFEASDLLLIVGSLPSDTNSGGFTRQFPPAKSLSFDTHSATLLGTPHPQIPLKPFLSALHSALDSTLTPHPPPPTLHPAPPEPDAHSKRITQSYLWPRLAAHLQPHDVLFGETGTAAFGLPDTTNWPEDITWITQTYYGSIGYATPAAFGSELALRMRPTERQGGRTILVTGDGSLMLVVQEIGNMIKHGLRPIIFVINNAGYTIERIIHGAEKSYNDVVPFDYAHLLPFFSMPEEQARGCFHRAETKSELEDILKKDQLVRPQQVQIVEVVMGKLDVPWGLPTQLALRGEAAVKEMREAGFKPPRGLGGK